MADLRVVPAALVVWMALFTGVACASDQSSSAVREIGFILSTKVKNRVSTERKSTMSTLSSTLIRRLYRRGRILNGPDTPLAITQLSGDSISFKGTQPGYYVSGTINRLTGDAMIYAPDQTNPDGFTYSMRSYVRTCKPVKPLF